MKLLSKGNSNTKTAKNANLTYILYMSPWKQNARGKNLCADATIGCVNACLFTAGLASVYKSVNLARTRKTDFFVSNRIAFLNQLWKELNNASKLAIKKEVTAVVRLNGTTDLDFVKLFKSIGLDLLSLPNLIFYDYTKSIKKALAYKDNSNYTVTFSRSETNERDCITALQNGINVAVVADKKLPMPKNYLGFPVVDGDKQDDLMITEKGSVIWLRAKGRAKSDITGFVIRDYADVDTLTIPVYNLSTDEDETAKVNVYFIHDKLVSISDVLGVIISDFSKIGGLEFDTDSFDHYSEIVYCDILEYHINTNESKYVQGW